MRRSTDYYPDVAYIECDQCEYYGDTDVTEIQDDDVRVGCPECEEIYYVRIDF